MTPSRPGRGAWAWSFFGAERVGELGSHDELERRRRVHLLLERKI